MGRAGGEMQGEVLPAMTRLREALAEERYTNDAGETVTGVCTGLWVYFRDGPEADFTIRAYQGQQFER